MIYTRAASLFQAIHNRVGLKRENFPWQLYPNLVKPQQLI
jgi:hypothetical protein